MDSCGLSIDEAITASKKLNFKTTLKPDSILTLLETYGFTKPHISKLINKDPSLLLSKPDKTLKPKLAFFNSKGLSGIDLAKFISANPSILKCSLKNKIIPSFGMLNNICQADERVIGAVKRCSVLLSIDLNKSMMLNIELLRNVGVPSEKITWFLVSQPRTLTIRHVRFTGIVEKVKEMGFDPLESTFLHALQGLTARKSTWEAKLNVFRRLGLSEGEIRSAVKKQPMCMRVSEKKIVLIMDYLVNQMGYSALVITKFPQILTYSLEKRIVPRCCVSQILISRGLVKYQIPLTSLLIMAEKAFVEKFVTQFEKEAPELLLVYPSLRPRLLEDLNWMVTKYTGKKFPYQKECGICGTTTRLSERTAK
ncbi:hypothetical protein C5167_030310 [Papaver somniferum]|nr:hypothetical protein C5167_030310 [Papaver somniferum]